MVTNHNIKEKRVFNDPDTSRYTLQFREVPWHVYLKFKFHFLYPLFATAIAFYFAISFIATDTSWFSRTDYLIFLLIELITCGGGILFIRLTDFDALHELLSYNIKNDDMKKE